MAAYTWDIIRKKGKGIKVEVRFEKEEWEELVENDPTLIWWDDTPHGREFYSGFGKDKPKRHTAIFGYIEKTGKYVVQFQFSTLTGAIWSLVGPITPRKAMKVFEIADKLGSKVYKLGREITKESALGKTDQ